VTRLKVNAAYKIVEDRPVPLHSNVLTDQIIRLSGPQTRLKYPGLLRRVVVWDKKNAKQVELLSNLLNFGATTIGLIYRDRWEIELLFRCSSNISKSKPLWGPVPTL
jgi:IS4 transposase